MDTTWTITVSLAAAVLTALVSPWLARRAATKENDRLRAEDYEKRANTAESSQISRLFEEQDRMRTQYREDIAGLRLENAEYDKRVRALEQEVAEWRAGVRGVHGVWIAVPSSVWNYVRERLPELPPTRFPGETELPPADV